MARQYKNKTVLNLKGFEEWAEQISEMTKDGGKTDKIIEKHFDECSDIVVKSMEDQMQRTDVPQSLRSKARRWKSHVGNSYKFSYGFYGDEEAKMKAAWLNYGTPRRTTDKGYNRGRVVGRMFISNAKRSAAQKIKKNQKDALQEIMKG